MPNSPAPTAVAPSSKMPALRRAWDFVPGPVRRQIIRRMSNPAVRLKVLKLLRIRPEKGFFSLNRGLGALDTAMDRLSREGPAGDYYEFGLYRGYSFWYAQQSADRHGVNSMRFFGFDSFEGLPEVEGRDKEAAIFFSGDYACTSDEVQRQLRDHGFDWTRAALIEGYFDRALTAGIKEQHRMGPAALVLVDCDLYQSTVPVLDFLADLLQDGTVILFDDWYCFGGTDDSGEPRAFGEFLAAHPEWRAEEWMAFPVYGQAFVMRRTTATS